MIKFENIIKDKEYRERVIKYFRLPMRLSVSKEKFLSDLEFIKHINIDFYEQIIELTEKDFNKVALEQGKTELDLSAKEEDRIDFTMENILEPLLKKFEESQGWQEFIKTDYESKIIQLDNVATNIHQYYIKENDGKHFISIDLKAANWQSLQSIIGFDETYEELIVKYTDNLIPPLSKTFRTKITGILGAKNIMYYNKYLLQENKKDILEVIYNETQIDLRNKNLTAFYADEFLIEIDEATRETLKTLDISNLEQKILNKTGIGVHFTPFTLRWLNVNKACAKIYNNNEYEILNISKDILLLMDKIAHKVDPNYEVDFEKVKTGKKTKQEFISELEIIVKDIGKNIDK